MQKSGAIISPTLRPLYSWAKGTLPRIQDFNKSVVKNGKDKKKTNLMMQLPLTSISWYVHFKRLMTYK